ncbi:MAG: ROK family protein [Magnetococcus sp. WYHC-3]
MEPDRTSLRLGIDLGGTKMEAIALDLEGRELGRIRVPTPQGDYEGTLRELVALVTGLESRLGQHGTVGIGIPGAILPGSGVMKNGNSRHLVGKPLGADLERMLARPVRMGNDADCFCISEAVDGAAAGAKTVFGVILGTGCGGGWVVNGQPWQGPNAVAGEWGHVTLPWMTPEEFPGHACYCGHRGCVESWLSGTALARHFNETHGTDWDARRIAAAAAQGEARAEAFMGRYETRLARALAGIINTLDPEVIVLGGGVSQVERLYTQVPTLWERWIFGNHATTRLVKNRHGDSSGVRGAAWLWPLEGRTP